MKVQDKCDAKSNYEKKAGGAQGEDFEPPRLAALVPETSASTNSATWAPVRASAGIGTERTYPCQSHVDWADRRRPRCTRTGFAARICGPQRPGIHSPSASVSAGAADGWRAGIEQIPPRRAIQRHGSGRAATPPRAGSPEIRKQYDEDLSRCQRNVRPGPRHARACWRGRDAQPPPVSRGGGLFRQPRIGAGGAHQRGGSL